MTYIAAAALRRRAEGVGKMEKVYEVAVHIMDTYSPAYGLVNKFRFTKAELLRWCDCNKDFAFAGICEIKVDEVIFNGNHAWGWFTEGDREKFIDYVQSLKD